MKSMTGYGCGESASHGFKVTVEISSVNRKQAEVTIHLPRELEVLEAQIRDGIRHRISRGRLTVRVTLHVAAGKEAALIRLNRPLARDFDVLIEVGYRPGVTDNVGRTSAVFRFQTSDT